ncbi:IS3 family transposase [Streptococcus equi subsp. zooepidemicus]|uniref:IS3 family transposase n=1 Tax=Streptococcus equi TaxID=1336 RepID=UPI00294B685D|nr:IS3 family transposase [Streptococcus equi]WOK54313.1 IS3 family transposase [Streptococcus equi subsp. zooepidemicus]WOK56259.1 IS3 family transposase [Streptococcus equi subsp. zooepidemicus]
MKAMCKVLNVGETGYYKFRKNQNKPSKDDILSAAMQGILDEHLYNDNYGAPRMQLALKQRGIKAGIRRITRIMRENGWLHKPHRRPKGLTHTTTKVQEQENIIKQDFTADKPYTKMLTDISQIPCMDGKLYISPIMDCYNGEILSLEMRDDMKKELCIDTVINTVKRYDIRGSILHSDRGSQYTSEEFRKTLSDAGVIQSLSGVNHCFDNSRMESFFATLKKELLYRIPAYKMKRVEVKAIIFRYVFIYYNQKRVYTSNPGGLPPAVYKRLYEEGTPLVA